MPSLALSQTVNNKASPPPPSPRSTILYSITEMRRTDQKEARPPSKANTPTGITFVDLINKRMRFPVRSHRDAVIYAVQMTDVENISLGFFITSSGLQFHTIY